jgi:hypothetical protein
MATNTKSRRVYSKDPSTASIYNKQPLDIQKSIPSVNLSNLPILMIIAISSAYATALKMSISKQAFR